MENQQGGFGRAFPGFALAAVIGVAAFWTAKLSPVLDALVIALVIGILFRTVAGNRESLNPGLDLARRILIPVGLILYGVKMDFVKIFSLGWQVLVLQILIQIAVFAAVMGAARALRVSEKTALLIGTGTAICGVSAIAVTSPCIEGESKDTSISLLVITILGAIGTAVYVALAPFGLLANQYAFFVATTLHTTGYVNTAAGAVSEAVRKSAIAIKLFRTALLAPLAIILGFRQGRISERETGHVQAFPVPWFLGIFVFVGTLASIGIPLDKGGYASTAATYVFSIGLAAVGLDVNWRAVAAAGLRPFGLGLIGWIAAIVVSLAGALLLIS